ncbi:MAG: site-specific integrase [Lachnospiraceae bacterium]|nr:site-specific integrase [Lachnospiraceae bacterium]
MWIEKTQKGTYKFIERYKDPLTDKLKKVSITMDKNTASTRKLALDELNRKIAELTSTLVTDNITVKQLYDIYIKEQEENLKQSTVRRNKISVGKVVQLLGEDVIVNRLTAQYVRDKLSGQGEKANEYLTRFKAMINWGYENEYTDNISLVKKLKVNYEKSERQKVKGKYLETDELRKLLEHMSQGVPEWYYLTKFLVLSGLRVGEALPLYSSDVSTYISVTKTYDANNKVVTTPKTDDSVREVYVQPELAEVVNSIRLFIRTKRKSNKISSRLFLHKNNGDMLEYYSYLNYLKDISMAALGREITPHVLRHTHTSILAAQGVDLETISRRLGHHDSKITKAIYLHVTKELQERDNAQIRGTKIL